MSRICFALCLPFVCMLVGCSGGERLEPVEGVATLDGKPLAGATVYLIAQEPNGRSASGQVGANGSFRPATSGRDGVLHGNYKIIIGVIGSSSKDQTSIQDEAKAKQRINQPLKCGDLLIPAVYTNPATTPLRCTVPVDGKLKLELSGQAAVSR